MDDESDKLKHVLTRRQLLGGGAAGIGAMALNTMLAPEAFAAQFAKSTSHFAPQAKRIIFLYMAGGPSHLESFDYKPVLAERNGQSMPDSFTKGQPIAQLQGKKLTCRGPYFKFLRHGQSGQQISEVFQHIPTFYFFNFDFKFFIRTFAITT